MGMGESLLPKDNLSVNAIPKERGKMRNRRTGWRQRVHEWERAKTRSGRQARPCGRSASAGRTFSDFMVTREQE